MDISDLSALMGEDITQENYADLWVVFPDAAAAPLLGEARRLADGLGCYVHAVIPQPDLSEQAITLGADRVHTADDPAAYLAAQQPEFVFFPLERSAEAAWCAQRLRAGLITDARGLRVDDADRALIGSHPVYGGDYLVDVALTSPTKIASLDPRRLPAAFADPDRQGEALAGEAGVPAPASADLGPADYTPQAWRPLQRARIIVSAGRALRDEQGLALARQLAEKLGAELAGDRSAHDSGWIDEDHLVGVTGQEVAPDLYLALGIRGDTIHNAAITGARQVIAVHPRADAPIFAAADQCVVADPKDFLERLLAKL